MKFRLVGAEFVHGDGRTGRQAGRQADRQTDRQTYRSRDRHIDRETDRRTDMTNQIVAICNFADALKIVQSWKMLVVGISYQPGCVCFIASRGL